jgi:hypothetical protein
VVTNPSSHESCQLVASRVSGTWLFFFICSFLPQTCCPGEETQTWDRSEIQLGLKEKAGAQALPGQSGVSVQLVTIRVWFSLNLWKSGRQPIARNVQLAKAELSCVLMSSDQCMCKLLPCMCKVVVSPAGLLNCAHEVIVWLLGGTVYPDCFIDLTQ